MARAGRPRVARLLTAFGLACAAAGIISTSRADVPETLFREGTNALSEGKYEAAIRHLEAYADRGAPHPDASFNRGLAYVMRVRAGAERPGDLGRAAAAFEETLMLRPSDREAEHALDLVHAEVARQRARRGKDGITARPTLDRLVVSLATERAWGVGAAVASALLALGLALRRLRRRGVQIAGRVLSPTAAFALLLLMPLTLGARHIRQTSRPGVVVVPEVYLSDEAGVSQGGEAIPEAARVELGEQRGRLIAVRWGSFQGWIPRGAVRLLRTR